MREASQSSRDFHGHAGVGSFTPVNLVSRAASEEPVAAPANGAAMAKEGTSACVGVRHAKAPRMRNFRFGLVVVWSSVFGLLVTAACSEESEAPKDAIADDSGGDTKDASAAVDARSTNDDAEAKVDAQGSHCNALTVDGVPPSTISAVTAPAPAPVGGVIEDGTYFAVQYVIYGRPKAVPEAPYVRSKVVVTGNVWQAANADPVKAPVTN